jgi:membrane carboxypeptidase/penicillin-binding protein
MNSVYLGQYGRFEVHGFQRAARFYFDKEIGKLSLEGLATLVALIKGLIFVVDFFTMATASVASKEVTPLQCNVTKEINLVFT